MRRRNGETLPISKYVFLPIFWYNMVHLHHRNTFLKKKKRTPEVYVAQCGAEWRKTDTYWFSWETYIFLSFFLLKTIHQGWDMMSKHIGMCPEHHSNSMWRKNGVIWQKMANNGKNGLKCLKNHFFFFSFLWIWFIEVGIWHVSKLECAQNIYVTPRGLEMV